MAQYPPEVPHTLSAKWRSSLEALAAKPTFSTHSDRQVGCPKMPEGSDHKLPANSLAVAPRVVPGGCDTAHVFISYASADSSIANAVCSALEHQGVRCWIAPRDVTPGDLYAADIVHAIDTTQVLVLVLSQHAANSGHVLREVERASSKRHPILSFRTDQAPLPEGLEYFLNTSQWLDASAIGTDRALPKLVDAVRKGLGKPAAGARVDQGPLLTTRANKRPSPVLLGLAFVVAIALAYAVVDQFWLSKRVDAQKALVEATPAAPAGTLGALTIPASRSRYCPSRI